MQRAFGSGGLIGRLVQRRSRRGGHGDGGSWFAPGDRDPTGILFNETPPPPGQSRKWEDWELPYYITGVLTVIILGVGLNAKPDTRIEIWARKEAEKRLLASGLLEDEASV